MYAKCFIYFKCFNELFKLKFWWISQHASCPVERFQLKVILKHILADFFGHSCYAGQVFALSTTQRVNRRSSDESLGSLETCIIC